MIGRISRFMTRFVSRWLPDPLIFAMLLTLLTFVIALWLTPQTPISMVKMWGDGFWNLLAFGMQMALIIVTGHALASSAPVKVCCVLPPPPQRRPYRASCWLLSSVQSLVSSTGDLVWLSAQCLPVKSPAEYPVLIIRCSLPAPTLVSHLGWRFLWLNASVGCNTGQPG